MYKAYGKCLTGIGKQIYSIIKSTATKALRNHCILNPKRKFLILFFFLKRVWSHLFIFSLGSLEHLSCFDERLTSKYRKCLFKFGDSLTYASEMAEEDDIFSSLCCGFNGLSNCLDTTFQSNGACTDPKINLRAYSKTLFKNLFGTVADTFCATYTNGKIIFFIFIRSNLDLNFF